MSKLEDLANPPEPVAPSAPAGDPPPTDDDESNVVPIREEETNAAA